MKRVIYALSAAALLTVGIIACTKEHAIQNISLEEVKTKNSASMGSITHLNAGEHHNNLISIYYSKYPERVKEFIEGTVSLDEKIMIVDEYYKQHNIKPLFSEIVANNQKILEFLNMMQSNETSLDFYNNYFELNTQNTKALEMQKKSIDILKGENIIEGFTSFEKEIMQSEFGKQLKHSIIASIKVTIASNDWWEEESNDEIAAGWPGWIVKDAMGAWFALESGMTGVATTVAGPVAGAAVTVAVSAISSMN
jgi:hypothetical protein